MAANRLSRSFSKFFFCFRISGSWRSFCYLLWNTKKFRSHKEKGQGRRIHTRPVSYCLHIGQEKRSISLRTFEGDLDIFYEVFWDEAYTLPQQYFDEFRLILDLGSNTGLSALYFLNRSTAAKIICIEPEAGNFEILTANLQQEIQAGEVIALQAAVMDRDGLVSMSATPLAYNSQVQQNGNISNPVKAMAMDSLLTYFHIDHIDLVKMDVEGAEGKIFAAETDWLERVDHLLIEWHSQADQEICIQALRNKGFDISPCGGKLPQARMFWAKRKS